MLYVVFANSFALLIVYVFVLVCGCGRVWLTVWLWLCGLPWYTHTNTNFLFLPLRHTPQSINVPATQTNKHNCSLTHKHERFLTPRHKHSGAVIRVDTEYLNTAITPYVTSYRSGFLRTDQSFRKEEKKIWNYIGKKKKSTVEVVRRPRETAAGHEEVNTSRRKLKTKLHKEEKEAN